MNNEQVITKDDGKGAEVDEEQYNYYAGQRKAFANQSRCEIAAQHYPSKPSAELTEQEWEVIQPHINTKFRELLVEAFPHNHLQMNNVYLSRKPP